LDLLGLVANAGVLERIDNCHCADAKLQTAAMNLPASENYRRGETDENCALYVQIQKLTFQVQMFAN